MLNLSLEINKKGVYYEIGGKGCSNHGKFQGIGAATAIRMAEEGADIIINYPFAAEEENAAAVREKNHKFRPSGPYY